MTDFSFKNHIRPTVDQLCAYRSMINLAPWSQPITDLQLCVLLDIPVNEFMERKNYPLSEELWGAERVAQELNVSLELVAVLHAQGRIVGWEDGETGTIYPARQFVNGELFNRVSMLVECLRSGGYDDKSISRYVFEPIRSLGCFSYAHLADESVDHTQRILGVLQSEFLNSRRAREYLQGAEGTITASSVTDVNTLNKWKNLHSGDVIVSKTRANYALQVEAAAKLEASLGVSFKTILARNIITCNSPFPTGWVPISKISESLGITEEQLDKMLYPTPDSPRWKRPRDNDEIHYHSSYFIFGAGGEIEINMAAQRLEKLLTRLEELGYPHKVPSVNYPELYLGNVSMREYANVSPAHEEALVNLLERTIQELEGGTRKRGKNKTAA